MFLPGKAYRQEDPVKSGPRPFGTGTGGGTAALVTQQMLIRYQRLYLSFPVIYMVRYMNGLSGFRIPVETGTTPVGTKDTTEWMVCQYFTRREYMSARVIWMMKSLPYGKGRAIMLKSFKQ